MEANAPNSFQTRLIASGLIRSEASALISTIIQEFRGVRLRQGEVFSEQGKEARWLAIVESGSIRQTFVENNRSTTLAKYSRGQIVGANEIARGSYFYGFNACEETVLRIVDAQEFKRWISIDIIQDSIFTFASLPELFEVLRESSIASSIDSSRLFDFCTATCTHDIDSIKVINGRPTDLQEAEDGLILCASNRGDNFKIGSDIPLETDLGVFSPDSRVLLLNKQLRLQLEEIKDLQRFETSDRQEKKVRASVPDGPSDTREAFELIASSSLRERYGGDGKDDAHTLPNVSVRDRNDQSEIAAAVLRCLSLYFEIPYRRDSIELAIKQRVSEQESYLFTLFSYSTLVDLLDIQAEIIRIDREDLYRAPFPVLLIQGNNGRNGPIIIWGASESKFLATTFSHSIERLENDEIFQDGSTFVELLTFQRSSYAKLSRFGLTWFLPTLLKYKSTLGLVFIASFFVQLLALLNPLLIQQIIDAVISQGNISSLNIYGTLLIGMALTEGLLSALRTFLLSDTTNRIDISLGGMVIDHLMRLPLNYFSKRPVGEVSNRVNELEKIREFLTGTGLTSVLDGVFAIIYIGVMLIYSIQLTLWSLSVIPLFLVLAFTVAPLIRRQIEIRSEAQAKVQSHLVEALGGVETIKTQNLEFQSKWRWRQLYNKQIKRAFRTTVTSSTASSISKFLEQLSGLIIIWAGASMVLKSELTVGQLIAFRILSGYVTGPVLRLAMLWQNFQETSISIQRLGDVVNTPTESEVHGLGLPPLPPIRGQISYNNVSFRFHSAGTLQLNSVSLRIDNGQFVGIVGGSGSGKSTLVKLLSGLYKPESGVIKVDGFDINKCDLYSLRSQIGIVPQDSLLFDGTIRDNVSISRPDASLKEINDALDIACATEFVEAMPLGISSNVGERGAGLSGGQKQRIAIARMLISKPRLVILDEATSALDVDTERRLLKNLSKHLKGTTLLFITHRISTIKEADQIIVMDRGIIEESGTHAQLLKEKGRYAALLSQQYAEGLVE